MTDETRQSPTDAVSHEMLVLRAQTHALCQDCLRLQPVSSLVPCENDPPGLCPACNGQTCDCASCMRTSFELEAGIFGSLLRGPAAYQSWSADGGIVRKQLPNSHRPDGAQ
jgi:hypothetical protein